MKQLPLPQPSNPLTIPPFTSAQNTHHIIRKWRLEGACSGKLLRSEERDMEGVSMGVNDHRQWGEGSLDLGALGPSVGFATN